MFFQDDHHTTTMPISYQQLKQLEELSGDKNTFSREEVILLLDKLQQVDNSIDEEQGMPFKKFREFSRYLLNRNLANFDSMVLITGIKGVGKSSFGINIIRYWCKLLGIPFRMSDYIAYTNAQVQYSIKKLRPFSPILADEAIRFASAADWAKAENKELKRTLGQIRTKHLLFVLCFPLKISKLESNYLESYVNYWVHVFQRGHAALFVRDENPESDSWRLRSFRDIGSFTEFTSPERVRGKLEKHPNFWTTLRYPKVAPTVYKKYMRLRDDNVFGNAGALDVSRKDIHRSIVLHALYDSLLEMPGYTDRKLLRHIEFHYGIKVSSTALKDMLLEARQYLDSAYGENVSGKLK